MDLKDAIDWPSDQNQGGGIWPGESNNQLWPGTNPQQRGGNSEGGMWGNPHANNPVPAAPGNLNVPHKRRLLNGIQDKVITIDGIVKPNPVKLTVDLSAGQELVFHLNPRFKDEVDGMVTVMNSRLAQQWGTEERDRKHFPFVPGQRFQIKIQCTSQGFKVQVNNHDLPIFKHRTNPGSVDTLSIDNDLSLIDVFVN